MIDYEKYGDKYSSFCHLLMNEKISLNDFDDFRKNNIQQLIDENYLKVNEKWNIGIRETKT
ncbi:hypothetical protein [Chryseobacterium wanjuense]